MIHNIHPSFITEGSETESEKRARLELEEETEEKAEDQITEKIQDRDSDYHTISNLTSSQVKL